MRFLEIELAEEEGCIKAEPRWPELAVMMTWRHVGVLNRTESGDEATKLLPLNMLIVEIDLGELGVEGE